MLIIIYSTSLSKTTHALDGNLKILSREIVIVQGLEFDPYDTKHTSTTLSDTWVNHSINISTWGHNASINKIIPKNLQDGGEGKQTKESFEEIRRKPTCCKNNSGEPIFRLDKKIPSKK